MLKQIGFFITFILPLSVGWANTIKPTIDTSDGKGTVFAGRAGVYHEMVTDDGTGTSSSDELEAYIPIDSGGSASYSILDSTGATIPDTATATSFVRVNMSIANTTSDTQYLHAAVKNDGTYEWFQLASFTTSYAGPTTLSESELVYISTTNLCAVSTTSCTGGDKQEIYLFFHTDGYSAFSSGDEISTSSYPDGAYFTLRLSAAASGVQTKSVNLNSIDAGDKRLKLVYDGQTLGDDFHQIAIVNYADDITKISFTYSNVLASGGSLLERIDSTQADGELTINDLINERTYNLAIGFVDRYQFVTPFSASLLGTPEEIEAFLEKQACYLLSAGFQEEHYILDYFRAFRDSVLLESSLGTKFVEWYYATAPKYARIIYKSSILSAGIRTAGYIAYFVMNHILTILLGGICALGLLYIYRFRKI